MMSPGSMQFLFLKMWRLSPSAVLKTAFMCWKKDLATFQVAVEKGHSYRTTTEGNKQRDNWQYAKFMTTNLKRLLITSLFLFLFKYYYKMRHLNDRYDYKSDTNEAVNQLDHCLSAREWTNSPSFSSLQNPFCLSTHNSADAHTAVKINKNLERVLYVRSCPIFNDAGY